MINKIIIILISLLSIIFFYKISQHERFQIIHNNLLLNKPKIIMTCSTYFAKPNKFKQFTNAIDSIINDDLLLIDKLIYINEYDISENTIIKPEDRHLGPKCYFIQKTKEQKGQAHTLNIILDNIKSFDFWIHWEESWIATDTFVKKSLRIMEESPDISQLQFTPCWRDIDSQRLIKHNKYFKVLLDPLYNIIDHSVFKFSEMYDKYGLEKIWPLFSLRPSINRVKSLESIDKFNEDPTLWPILLEYEYGVRWIKSGAIKAIIDPPVAIRQPNHISTYM